MKLGSPQSFNRYAYVLNDPVNHNDPSGLDGENGICFSGGNSCEGMVDPNVYLATTGSSTFTVDVTGSAGHDATPPTPDPLLAFSLGGGTGAPAGGPRGGAGGAGNAVSLAFLKAVFLVPAVTGAEALLMDPDCASLFDIGAMGSNFGTTVPANILSNAYQQGQIWLGPFGDNINPAVQAQTSGTNGVILKQS